MDVCCLVSCTVARNVYETAINPVSRCCPGPVVCLLPACLPVSLEEALQSSFSPMAAKQREGLSVHGSIAAFFCRMKSPTHRICCTVVRALPFHTFVG